MTTNLEELHLSILSSIRPNSFSRFEVPRTLYKLHLELDQDDTQEQQSNFNITMNHLKNLSYIKIDYFENSPLDDPFSLENIIEKRRQAFPMNIIHEQLINVKNDGEVIEIWLK
ncbi:unnamed protein product [Adineta steineri]|uniref:Uncharacterized protein n=1 Tax=Adineta steineri TaxID=433720 RepID=A0A815S5U4_9BILA|nr:unnamed protein product [Adineta steineri]CAF1486495.1 unnamed protein product [Adineta steineri]